eukprot:1097435_1
MASKKQTHRELPQEDSDEALEDVDLTQTKDENTNEKRKKNVLKHQKEMAETAVGIVDTWIPEKLVMRGIKLMIGIVDTWIPEKLVMRGIKLMIGIYGFTGVICIVLILMYCIDYYASTVWDTYPR